MSLCLVILSAALESQEKTFLPNSYTSNLNTIEVHGSPIADLCVVNTWLHFLGAHSYS